MKIKKTGNVGLSTSNIFNEIRKVELERSKEKGKCLGKCESCGMETVLVEDVMLCGPCCFGEAKTIMGNW